MKRLVKGDKVVVNKDHFRIETVECTEPIVETMLYAKAGETGVIVETFAREREARGGKNRWFAKVLIDEKIKTFRLTSLTKL